MQRGYQSANYQLSSPTKATPSMKTCDKYRGVDIQQWRALFAEVNSCPSQTPRTNLQRQAPQTLKYRSADIQQWRALFGAVNGCVLSN
ncbi:MAG: hypothetical protein F6K41_38530 [Symploca sp. SIO3E6]|nr:hypothetical protein [Caldora sp. SIO3E6]